MWPLDSVIEDYVLLARRYSEGEDSILTGSFLPVISAVLARNVYINFGQRIFPNLYHVIVAKPGLRKSMTIDLVTRIARNLLPKEAFVSGVTSNQALFLEYLKHPDKLWVIDEGNVILDNWAHDAAGKGVGQLLALYDCPPWGRITSSTRKRGQGDPSSRDKHLDPAWRDARKRSLQRPPALRRPFV